MHGWRRCWRRSRSRICRWRWRGTRIGSLTKIPTLTAEASRFPVDDAELVVAKSMGTMVLLASAAATAPPGCAVLIGTPLVGYSPEQKAALVALANRIPCLFIQQSADFTGTYESLTAELQGVEATLVEVAGHDHVYADTDMLGATIDDWLEEISRG